MARLFGTDGVRGLANGDLTAALALDLSVAAAHVLADLGEFEGHRPLAVVGRDTRISGQFLEAAVVAGLASAGVDVLLLGVLPTPGSPTSPRRSAPTSASCSPPRTTRCPTTASSSSPAAGSSSTTPSRSRSSNVWARTGGGPIGGDVGRVDAYATAVEEYAAHLVRTIDHPLAGLRVVLDCADGRRVRRRAAGARGRRREVIAIHAQPDGLNINDGCGSTHLDSLRAAVLEHGADVGFALDGDADRCLAVDHEGNVVDGDQILAILALAMKEAGRLVKDTVVATVMSNLGFVQAMRAAGIGVRQTKVGDRYVLEAMQVTGYNLGGEQSGHVIMSDYATTGDGDPDRPARAGADGHHRAEPEGPRLGGEPAARRCSSTSPTSTSPAPTRTPSWPPPWPRRRPRSATPAGSCCAPRAPSRSCG